jgi:hypothetical protein
MKKYIIVCCLMLIVLGVNGQINTNDGWSVILDEQFTGFGRGWNSQYEEQRPASIPDDSAWVCRWRVDASELTDGVTKEGYHHAYQKGNALFNNSIYNDNKMRLVAQWVSDTPLMCDGFYPTGYEIPHGTWHHCDTVLKTIYYYSSNIQSRHQNYHYGYYEIECALPVHPGIHTSFWLFGGLEDSIVGIKCYEEIDIMEYSRGDYGNDMYRGYSSGIWFRQQNINDSLKPVHYGYKQFHIPQSDPEITNMHIYGCEWMPDHVVFYRDGEVIHEIYDEEHIPKSPKYIKTGYAIDDDALIKVMNLLEIPKWRTSDTITINQIKVYGLITDCGTNEYIQSVQQLNQINSMKRSITFSNTNGIVVPSTINKILRASDYILINEPIEIAAGTQLTLMVHTCPTCITDYNNKSNP